LSQRLKRLAFTPEFLLDLMMPGRHAFEVVENGLPRDAALYALRFDAWNGRIEALVSSESYAELPEGTLPPEAALPVFRAVRPAVDIVIAPPAPAAEDR
jgi:hypothetical protein